MVTVYTVFQVVVPGRVTKLNNYMLLSRLFDCMFLFKFLSEVVTKCLSSHMEKKDFSSHVKSICHCFDRFVGNNSVGLSVDTHHSKDDFSHKPTSSRFTHV